MFYRFFKIFTKLFIQFYCSKVIIDKKELLKCNGPVLLAVNHPNSFLDAIILCTFFKEPIFSLARGDVFKNKILAKFLRSLKIFPVFRNSEGVKNLDHNYTTFNECIKIFQQGGMVLIFSEGLCLNEWQLRPLKKGTARLAIAAWQQNIPLKILPIGINYSNFQSFGKTIHINIGNFIEAKDFGNITIENGRLLNAITCSIHEQLQFLVYEIAINNYQKWVETFQFSPNKFKKILLAVPAFIGKLINAPLYYPVQKIVSKKALYSGHYDSIMVTVLLFTYPIYLLMCALIAQLFLEEYSFEYVFILFPFFAWCFIQTKPQTF